MNSILFIVGLVVLFAFLDWLGYKLRDQTPDTTHHDHKKFSHYSISHQVRRDEIKRRGY